MFDAAGIDARAAVQVEEDRVLPEQYFDSGRLPGSGEMQLLWRVFVTGLLDFEQGPGTSLRQRQAYREAQEWIWIEGESSILSFTGLCELFGIDPERLRARLARRRLADAA